VKGGCVVSGEWQAVDSSAIQAVKHDSDGMHIRYASGAEYVHRGVSQSTFEAFLQADSHGRYFSAHIARQHPGKLKR
jgi:hypothetical protein